MNPGSRGGHPTGKDSPLFMSSRPGPSRGGSTVTGAARSYQAPARPLQHSPPPGLANGGSHSPTSHSPSFGAPSPQNETANYPGQLANGFRPRAASGPRMPAILSPPRIDHVVETFCGVSNVLREQADEAAAFTFPDLAEDEAEELKNKFDEARRKRSLERQETINRAYGNIAQTLQEVMESYVARALAPHVEVMRQTAAAVQDLTSRFDQLANEVDGLKTTVSTQARPAPPTGPSAARLPPGVSAPAGPSIDPARLDRLEKEIGECGAHLTAVKKQVGADQEKLAKLPDIESRIGALEKQASQTTDPRKRPGSTIGAVPTPPPPPGPSPVELQKAAELEKTVGEVKGRVDKFEARIGVVDELEKKVADVQLRVEEVAKDIAKKKDADDMEIDDDSGGKLSVLEKRLEEVREELVKEVGAVKDDVDKVSSRKTVPPEHVPLVASLAHFAAAGQPNLSSEELVNRLESGLRGWDAGLGSHEERITMLYGELAEYRQASDKKFVDVSEVTEAYLPLASQIAAYLRRGQIRGRFPTPQEIGFPDDFRLDVPANGFNGATDSRQTSPARSQTHQSAAGMGAATSPSRVAPGQGSASPTAGSGGNGHRRSGAS
ncbi:hypothetical protein AAT19DRAFT_15725 [Rhodotorula toruloides]|uniref:Uncharacterized protein n=1 Tax=Rhodotorula toruloides TaxID=5286 RepID=A0A2T0A4N0_RHOTO|nr:hypothetical protein AAT19DRAFT_15725 [Rhodotorula toruloides]